MKLKFLTFLLITISTVVKSQTISFQEADYLLSLNFEKANSILIAKEFEYTSVKEYPDSKWLYYRRLNNDRDYEVGIQIAKNGNVVGIDLLTTNFYEANVFKKMIEKNFSMLPTKMNGQSMETRFFGPINSTKDGSYTISVDPSGSGLKAYYIVIRDHN
jgi:hypothetical protein